MMKKQTMGCLLLGLMLALCGCGSIPDVVVQAAKESAKAEIEQKIDELLAQYADQVDLGTFFPNVLGGDSQAEDDPARDPVR